MRGIKLRGPKTYMNLDCEENEREVKELKSKYSVTELIEIYDKIYNKEPGYENKKTLIDSYIEWDYNTEQYKITHVYETIDYFGELLLTYIKLEYLMEDDENLLAEEWREEIKNNKSAYQLIKR